MKRLKKRIKRFSIYLFISILLISCLSFPSFAVDPVSASVMANAMAQAIAAYGASNGVAMTFDVSSTDGIGETVHDLWKSFREGTQDADDYATLAAALFPELYYKASSAVAVGSDIYSVGVHISDTYAEEFDNFYNWLLSGPAELVQVDNSYYEFSSAQIGPNAVPITVNTITLAQLGSLPLVPVHVGTSWDIYSSNTHGVATVTSITNGPVYAYGVSPGSNVIYLQLINYSNNDGTVTVRVSDWDYSEYDRTFYINGDLYTSDGSTTVNGFNWVQAGQAYNFVSPSFTGYSGQTIPADFGVIASSTVDTASDTIGVKSYDDVGIADFPDTADPNYDALHRAKDIPLDIPWDDTLYGDGTDALTGAQSEAIASDVDLSLVEDGVIELVEEGNPPAPSPSEVFIPLLPVTAPSFNFNLAGIWHYVREWVQSISSFLSFVLTLWASLPWAIVVPVYASLVIVIVLGVYRRFFM